MSTVKVSPESLRVRIARIFGQLGVPDADAVIASGHLVEADLRGVHSHGVIRVPTYVKELRAGLINPRPTISIVSDHGGQLVVDGDNALGQVARTMRTRSRSSAVARTGWLQSRFDTATIAGRWPTTQRGRCHTD